MTPLQSGHFPPLKRGNLSKLIGGYIDLEIEYVDSDHVLAVIRTKLPKEFSLEIGDTIEVWQDKIMYKNEYLGN